MMLGIIKVAVSFGLIATTLFFSPKEEIVVDKKDRIHWSASEKLTWEDFKGSPDYKNRFASAISSTGIIYRYRCQQGVISISVESIFIKSESWVKSSALTDYHLQHEQLHFDITELYTRKLRQELNQRIYYCGEEKILERLVNSKLEQWDEEQKIYDGQTRHSLNEEKQFVWNDLIESELLTLIEYSSDQTEN